MQCTTVALAPPCVHISRCPITPDNRLLLFLSQVYLAEKKSRLLGVCDGEAERQSDQGDDSRLHGQQARDLLLTRPKKKPPPPPGDKTSRAECFRSRGQGSQQPHAQGADAHTRWTGVSWKIKKTRDRAKKMRKQAVSSVRNKKVTLCHPTERVQSSFFVTFAASPKATTPSCNKQLGYERCCHIARSGCSRSSKNGMWR